jgi:hypothetical protein
MMGFDRSPIKLIVKSINRAKSQDGKGQRRSIIPQEVVA